MSDDLKDKKDIVDSLWDLLSRMETTSLKGHNLGMDMLEVEEPMHILAERLGSLELDIENV